jgi:predicted enzyme related to lactoylglutathione lyase
VSKVVLWASDLQAQISFYSALFNVKVDPDGSDFQEVSDSNNSVLLHRLPHQFAAPTPLKAQLPAIEEAAIKPVFTVDSLESARLRTQFSYASFSDSVHTYGDFRYQDVVDPEGNVIQLQEPLLKM